MTSTLLILGSRPGTYPLIEEEAEELQNTQASLSRQIIALPVPTTVVVVIVSHEDSAIPLPWVSRLAKLKGKGRGKVVRLQQRLSKYGG